ncbi:MAG: 3-isopropylmalate dehydratase large subunit [Candidatus Woesearchaeota archaeon]
MGTLVEEIFSRKLNKNVKAGDLVIADVDFIMSHDNTTPLAIKSFREVGKPIKDKSKIVIHFDHAYPAPNLLAAEAQKKTTDFIKEQNIENFFKRGVCHQVMIEEGFIIPGNIVIGADSHSNTYGALGCFSSGYGSTEIAVAWITGKLWFKIPETIKINMTGSLNKGVYAKDVMIYIAGLLGMDGATYKSVEFSGSFIENLPIHERIVFSNMSTEIGAKCGLINSDKKTIEFLKKETKALERFDEKNLIELYPKNPKYEKIIDINVSEIEPMVSCHPDVDNVKKLKDLEGLEIDEVFIGTCTNARYEDLEIAASILKGKKVNKFTRTIITPASNTIYEKALKNGLIKIFMDAGCTITNPGCGACIGRHGGLLAPKEKAFTTMNRNFIGRMGSPEAEIYLGSPAAAAATAIMGKITDPRKFLGE